MMRGRTGDAPYAVCLAPEEVARATRTREGFVFLESSLATADSISLLAWEPDLILEGDASDWEHTGTRVGSDGESLAQISVFQRAPPSDGSDLTETSGSASTKNPPFFFMDLRDGTIPETFPVARRSCQIFPGFRFVRGSEESNSRKWFGRRRITLLQVTSTRFAFLMPSMRSFLRTHGHSTRRFDIIHPRPTGHSSILEVRRSRPRHRSVFFGSAAGGS